MDFEIGWLRVQILGVVK